MSLKHITDPAAVHQAMAEFDEIGREAFLEKYGFGDARGLYVVNDGKRYDSKAIAGAAHGYQTGVPLAHWEFNSGQKTVRARLEKLGFRVVDDRSDVDQRAPDDLEVGDRLTNKQVVQIFQVGNQGGMRRSLRAGHLVIVSDHTKSLYDDRWESGTLHYTGMGAQGDQTLTSQNPRLPAYTSICSKCTVAVCMCFVVRSSSRNRPIKRPKSTSAAWIAWCGCFPCDRAAVQCLPFHPQMILRRCGPSDKERCEINRSMNCEFEHVLGKKGLRDDRR